MESTPVAGTSPAHLIGEFLTTSPSVLTRNATERLTASGFTSGVRSGRRRLPADKWMLSSAVQKLIRRGQAEQAVRTALALHVVDPEYLPRRLPIIAFEDVAIGNLEVCFDVLLVFGKERFPRAATELDRRQLLANLVWRLARSAKSRTGCDIFCLAHADQATSAAAAKFATSSEQCLVAMASDRSAAFTSRALAFHLLTGMSVREGRWPRTVSRFNADALRTVAEKLDLPEVIAWMLVEGRSTSGLAAMVPLVLEAIARSQPPRIMQHELLAEESIFGLPACAADMYTRVGKHVTAEFAKAIRDKHPRFFEGVPDARAHAKLLGMALFHAEGSKLDRWVESGTLTEYREAIEEAELRGLGWPKSEPRHRVYQMLDAERRLLWQIRRSHMRAAFGKCRRGE